MAMRYGYFDSEITGVDENGMPIFDRAETSDLFRMLFANLVSNGVLASPGDCFQVVAGTGMTVRIRPGFAMIKGAFAYDADEATVTLAAANANLPRLDRVVLRCNYHDRCCEIIVKTGTPSTVPVAPELLQPENGDYYELGLALITVAANQAAITQSSISDTRADSSVCGLITQLIDHIDTSEFMQQLTTWQEEYAAKQQAAFSTWFEAMKDQLSEDAAGNLQLEIDNLSQSAKAHDESIGQINEIIGDADMGSTDPTIRGAIREILNKIGDVAMGTTAGTVTGAIKELVTKIGSVAMGTTATTVTGAIKELKTALTNLQTHDNNQGVFYKVVTLGTFNVESSGACERTVSVASHIPSGYSLQAVIPRTTGSYALYFYTCAVASGQKSIWFQIFRAANYFTSVTQCTPTVTIVCKRNL